MRENLEMAVRCSRCIGFKRSYKSPCKKCANRRSGQRGRGFKSFFKKAKNAVKKAPKSYIAKMAISQGLAYAPKRYDMGTSKIKNKKIEKLLNLR